MIACAKDQVRELVKAGGILTNALRTSPSGVILIDEIEKASPEAVQNILLPLLGEGTVTDRNNGETLRASGYVVFCTSNLVVHPGGAGGWGFHSSARTSAAPRDPAELLTPYLRSEVVGRLHAALLYQPLDLEAKWAVWLALQRDLQSRMGEESRLVLDESARDWVKVQLRAVQTGARGVENLFHDHLVPLVSALGAGQTARITVQAGQLLRVPSRRRNARAAAPPPSAPMEESTNPSPIPKGGQS